jgi:hypothetical protein
MGGLLSPQLVHDLCVHPLPLVALVGEVLYVLAKVAHIPFQRVNPSLVLMSRAALGSPHIHGCKEQEKKRPSQQIRADAVIVVNQVVDGGHGAHHTQNPANNPAQYSAADAHCGFGHRCA